MKSIHVTFSLRNLSDVARAAYKQNESAWEDAFIGSAKEGLKDFYPDYILDVQVGAADKLYVLGATDGLVTMKDVVARVVYVAAETAVPFSFPAVDDTDPPGTGFVERDS